MMSVLLATLGRKDELRACLDSIVRQQGVVFEVLVLDQNPPEFLRELRALYATSQVRWELLPSKGLSKARNVGLRLARYDLISLADDDSVFVDPDHLSRACVLLRRHDFVSGICISKDGSDANRFFPHHDNVIFRSTLFSSIMSPCFFFRRRAGVFFDERLGVGADFGSGEETDFSIELLEQGFRGYYTRNLKVFHPEGELKQFSLQRRYKYALGVGALVRKRRQFLGFRLCIRKLFGPSLQAAYALIRLMPRSAFFYGVDQIGRLKGFVQYVRLPKIY